MVTINPLLPIPIVVIYFGIAFCVLLLCLVSSVAIYRTKKTPYATKILSMTLLTYDSLTLIFSSVSRLYDYNDLYLVWHITRGFQIAAQIVVGLMALERLFALKRPYIYLRMVTGQRIRIASLSVFLFGFLQYVILRYTMCYAMNNPTSCGPAISIYFILVSFLVPFVSLVSYAKIYRIIYKTKGRLQMTKTIRQYKGTAASFTFLINATLAQIIFLGLSAINFVRNSSAITKDGLLGTLADIWSLVSCTADPLIFAVWFRETRMELLKMVRGPCPWVSPVIERLRVEIFQVPVSTTMRSEQNK